MAFVTRSQYSAEVAVRPLYIDKYVFVSGLESKYGTVVHPSELSVDQEVYLDWNLAFIQWHSYWFGETMPKLSVGSTDIMRCVLKEQDMWAVAPLSVARALEEGDGVKISELREAPEGRTGYLLHRNAEGLSKLHQNFIDTMEETLREKNIHWIFR